MKDAMIAKEHAHGDLECTIFNMDIRSFGKDYEKYYNSRRQGRHPLRALAGPLGGRAAGDRQPVDALRG